MIAAIEDMDGADGNLGNAREQKGLAFDGPRAIDEGALGNANLICNHILWRAAAEAGMRVRWVGER
jgi:hypothetical protein